MKLQPVDHPVIGQLRPDKWGESLMRFCEIPGLKIFTPEHGGETLAQLEPADRKLVAGWSEVTEKLIKKCRNFEIFDSLRALGVYEAGFSRTAAGTPSDEQVAAWEYLQQHQAAFSATLANALLRYYQAARAADEDWFDQNDCPAISSLDELGSRAVFDSVSFTNQSCEGLAVLSLSWSVDWDVEHGLQMFAWKDQVIGIGVEDLMEMSDPVVAEYSIWNRSHMTDAERDALDRVSAHLEDREDEDFDGEYEDDEFDEDDDDE